jgi:hypothetical protein
VTRPILFVLVLAAAVAAAANEIAIAPFSASQPGEILPPGWRPITLPYGRQAQFSLVRDEGRTVLQVRSDDAFGTVAHSVSADPGSTPILAWRWKVDRALESANLETKEGEDFAARVYVSFDYPLQELSLLTRAKLRIARALYGDVPAAAICYVWDGRHVPGTSAWSPYFDHVRIIVIESGNARAGRWVEERRDVDADFRAAFGERLKGPTPRIVAVVAGNDSDQVHESVTAWFGDFKLEPRR